MFNKLLLIFTIMAVTNLAAEETPTPEIGRYITQAFKDDLYLVDTTTGAMWWFFHDSWGGYRWKKLRLVTPQDSQD